MINQRVHWLKLITASVSISVAGLTLSGCSTTSESFDCKAGHGVGCKSISDVNQMVNQAHLGSLVESDATWIKDKQFTLPSESAPLSVPVISADSLPVEHSKELVVHRMPEEYLRVWVAPYQDQQGNLHEGSMVHTVLKPGHWHLKSSPQSNNDSQVNETTNPNLEEND